MHLSALINWAHETFADGRPTPASNGMLCIEDSQIEKVAPINIDARHSALQLQIDSLYSVRRPAYSCVVADLRTHINYILTDSP